MTSFAQTGEVYYISGTDDLTEMTFRRARQITQVLTEGIEEDDDYLVKQTGAGAKSVDIDPGYCWVEGTTITGPEGQFFYGVPLTGTVTLDGITNPVSFTRRDLVVLQVLDEGDNPGSGLIEGRVVYITNTSEVTTDPAIPADTIILAHVTVTVGHGNILDADITDRRPVRGIALPSADGERYKAQVDASGLFVVRDSSGVKSGLGYDLGDLGNVDDAGAGLDDLLARDGSGGYIDQTPAQVAANILLGNLGNVTFSGTDKFDGIELDAAGTTFENFPDAFRGHYWRVNRTGAQGIANNAFDPVIWQAAAAGDESPTDLITFNSDTITVQEAGIYLIMTGLRFVNNATGIRGVRILTSGTAIATELQDENNASSVDRVNLATWASLSASQTITIEAFQNSGALLNVEGGAGETWFAGVLARRIGDVT